MAAFWFSIALKTLGKIFLVTLNQKAVWGVTGHCTCEKIAFGLFWTVPFSV